MDELSQIEETMLGPLWARAKYSEKYPELLNDQKAIKIIKDIDYNFEQMEQILGEWRAVGLMIRARRFDEALKAYMKAFPETAVVNIGAGLDTTFFRVDNSHIKMYNLDLPNVISYREKLIEETERNYNIAGSVFDYEWMEKIEFSKERGIFFIAGGFIYYFKEEKIANLVRTLAERFPGGEIIFDSVSSLAVKIVNKRAEKSGTDLRFELAMNKPEKIIPKWSEKIDIIDNFVIGKRTSTNKNWAFKTKIMNKVSTWLKTAHIIHLKFKV
ncbi:MAG: class I SAM-dependent methyltransferase [Candidatus Heimdallarchaeota archaeon]|nr:class I SAM-dependent methyltransferase [Candidatus Heimdallarchaeota archaeon]